MNTTSFKLASNPYPNQVSLCQAQVLPLYDEYDFESLASLPITDQPVHLSFAECYQLFDEILTLLIAEQSIHTVLLRISMPSGMRLPKSFLHEKVLMLQSTQEEADKLSQASIPSVVIDNQLVRFRLEHGDNTIHFRWQHLDSDMLANKMKELLAVRGMQLV